VDKPAFVYVTYIASTPERVWDALVDPKSTLKYWLKENISDWKTGSTWEHRAAGRGGKIYITGTVVESDRPRRLVLTWAFPEEMAQPEKVSRVTFDVEKLGDAVRLIVVHDKLEPGSDMEMGITDGWPRVLASLKSLLETGTALPTPVMRPTETPLPAGMR
jgi:uncharacterized protein YndB with AHSA1/START domain